MAIEKIESVDKQTSRVIRIYDLIVEQMSLLIRALETDDFELSKQVIKNDENINIEFQYILDKAIWILSQHTFLGEELRKIIGYNSIAKEIERLGDAIKEAAAFMIKRKPNVTERKLVTSGLKTIQPFLLKVKKLLKTLNVEDVKKLVMKINKSTFLYEEQRGDFIKAISNTSSIKQIKSLLDELFIAKKIEKATNYITNICEYIIYIATGQNFDLD